MGLRRRIELVLELIEREAMPKRWKGEAARQWNRLKKLAEVRNIVAHSPRALAWKGRPAGRPPDVFGIPNLKHIKRKHGRKLPLTPLPDLQRTTDEVVAI